MVVKKRLKPKLFIFLVGPTAVGKSAAGLRLARRIGAEIISCDSMQIYRGMDIITSKPCDRDRALIPHHLLDCIPPWQEFDVSQYRRLALSAAEAALNKGKIPLFVGGTGLYVSVLIDGIFREDTHDADIRRKLALQAEHGMPLHERLLEIDFAAAVKIHPNDTRRIIRALEVYLATGKKISDLQRQRKGLADEYHVRLFGLRMKPAVLYKRILLRVDEMFEHGACEEVKKLVKKKLSKTARAAIGIREIKGYLDGDYDEDEARRLMKHNTRQYARRQMTWFRKDKRVEWVDAEEADSPQDIAGRIHEMLAGSRVSGFVGCARKHANKQTSKP